MEPAEKQLYLRELPHSSIAWQVWWVTAAVVWTLVIASYGWLNLPRARYIPHDDQFLHNLSAESLSILRGDAASAQPLRGLWSVEPRIFRMANGMRLAFPAATTAARAALVADEYNGLLRKEADQLRLAYLLEILVVWFVPIVGMGFALQLARHGAWRPAGADATPPARELHAERNDPKPEPRLHDGPPASPA